MNIFGQTVDIVRYHECWLAPVYILTLHIEVPSVWVLFALQNDLVIYEMNVRAFTADESSGVDPRKRGSYLGLIEKVRLQHRGPFYLSCA